MTIVLITNIVLAAVVFTVIVGMIARTIRVSAPRPRTHVSQRTSAVARVPQTAAGRRRRYGSLVRET